MQNAGDMQMNRAERRRRERHGLTAAKEPVMNIKMSDIQAMKKQATDKAANTAFLLMLSIPIMVIHDCYGQLMRKEVNGKSREERFADLCIDLYNSFDKGDISLDDLAECLWDEAGIKLKRK